MAEITLRVLGSPHFERSGHRITVDTRKALALLTYLAVERRPQSRDVLAALHWPDYDQAHARAALRRTVSTLLKALEGEIVVAERETIALAGNTPLWVDVLQFQAHIASYRTHQHAPNTICSSCRHALISAIALYQDDFLAGFHLRDSAPFDDWQFTQSQAFRRELGLALSRLTRDATASGHLDAALRYAQRWLALDQLNEQAHRYLMRIFAWTGQQAAALQQYRACLQILDRELGVAPLDVTTRLYEAIKQRRMPRPLARLEQADQLSRTETLTHVVLPAAHHASREADHLAPNSTVITTAQSHRAQNSPDGTLPLIGRGPELQAIVNSYAASARTGQLLVIEGEVGIGKTRLGDEVMAYAHELGAISLFVRCYEGEATFPFAPIAAMVRVATKRTDQGAALSSSASDLWLSEVARLVPDLRDIYPYLPAPPALESTGAQVRFFEGVRQVLLNACHGTQPGVLCFDDVQWADAASLDLIAYLVRRLHDHAICLLLLWRGTDVVHSSLLRRILADAQRGGHATHVVLNRLDRADVRT